MLQILRVLALCALAALSTNAVAQKSADTLRTINDTPLETIDPYYTSFQSVFQSWGEMVFDALIFQTSGDETFQPLLAKSFTWIDDKTIEFELRDDVKWHDGQPFTADDVVYTFGYILNPENKTIRRDHYKFIDRVEKQDAHRVTMYLNRAYAVALPLITILPIVPEGFYGANGQVERLVGTGPYKFTNWTPGVGFSLERNEEYFKGGPKTSPAIKYFQHRFVRDPSVQINEVMSGGADWIYKTDPEATANLATQPNLQVDVEGSMRLSFVVFNAAGLNGDTPMKDVRVRRAIAHAIDRGAIAQQLVGMTGDVLHVPCSPIQFGCPTADQVTQYEFSPDKARALLAEAGYPNGFTVEFWVHENRPTSWVSTIQAYLAAVGINVEIKTLSGKVLLEGAARGEPPMYLISYGSQLRDVTQMWSAYFASGNERDLAKDEELMGWIDSAQNTTDAEERKELYRKAGERITDQVYWLPLWLEPTAYVYSKDLNFVGYDDEVFRFYDSSWK